MKFFILSVCFFSVLLPSKAINGQEPADGIFPLKDGKIYYEKIIVADSIKKEQMYKSIKSWGVNNFVSQKDVIQADDKELGFIAYKFFFTELFEGSAGLGTKFTVDRKYWAILKVYMKDYKAKVTVENLELDGGYSILTFERDQKANIPKNVKRSMEKIIDNQHEETRKNFIKANKHILDTIEELSKAVLSGKSEFDF